jgi:ParB family chromosome partitioning protein
MAKRKRLIAPNHGSQSDPDMPPMLEVKAFLRPGLGREAPIARVAGDEATQAALAEVSGELIRARAEGRLVQALPLTAIDADYLVRDRIGVDEDEMVHLMASIAEHGQRSPVEVTELAPGRYGLISGWRRLQALLRLQAQEGSTGFATIRALLRQPATASDAYIAMVEENEVRQGLSYYERARIAARAVDLGVFDSEKHALQRLFAAASRARRSKIGSFIPIYRALDGGLRFPAAIPERLGLNLAKVLDASPERVAELMAALQAAPAPSAAEEQTRLARFVVGKPGEAAKTVDTPGPPGRSELRPGVFLDVSGGWLKPVLMLSGPSVGPDFREALEQWLREPR